MHYQHIYFRYLTENNQNEAVLLRQPRKSKLNALSPRTKDVPGEI